MTIDPSTGRGRESIEHQRRHDVLVVGGGNAALCAAIAARRAGASVLVLEAADKFYRGGNTRHTRNMRCAHDHARTPSPAPTQSTSSGTTSSVSPAATPTRSSPAT